MADFSSTQIPKPRDEQAFERNSVILWRCILKDPSAKRHGRRGQRQHGVDIIGYRDKNQDNAVGIQCKLKDDGHTLTEREVRAEVEKSLTFTPLLSEYIITTTAPDDTKFTLLCDTLSIEKSRDREKPIKIQVLGWNSLEDEINRYEDAYRAFAPRYFPSISERMIEENSTRSQFDALLDIPAKLDEMREILRQPQAMDQKNIAHAIQSEQDQQINDYASLIGKDPKTAHMLLEQLQQRFDDNTPSIIRFRVAANIASCHLEQGDHDIAAQGLLDAYEFAPDDKRAITNKALALLLVEDWKTLRTFAEEQFERDGDNAQLAACYIRSLEPDDSVRDPRERVPARLRDTPEVAEAYVQWLMSRGGHGDWWAAAISAYGEHGDNGSLKTLYADALLQRAMGGTTVLRHRVVADHERTDAVRAVTILREQWRELLDSGRHLRPAFAGFLNNIIVGYMLLDEAGQALEVAEEAAVRFPEDTSIKEHLAILLGETGKLEDAAALLQHLQPTGQILPIRMGLAFSQGDWRTVRLLSDTYRDDVPESERDYLAALAAVADIELAPAQNRDSLLLKASESFPEDTRTQVVLSQCAQRHSLEDTAQTLFEAARLAFDKGDHDYTARWALAEQAMVFRRYRLAANILFGQISLNRDSPELRLLAAALVNDCPVRQRALEFFAALPLSVSNLPYFQRLEGALHFNRGAHQEAVAPLTAAFSKDRTAGNLFVLINCHMILEQEDDVEELLDSIDLATLSGLPLDRMKLARIMVEYGCAQQALKISYEILCMEHNDADVVHTFIGLVLSATQKNIIDISDRAISGTWVRAVSDTKDSWEAILGEDDNRVWGKQAELSNPFVKKLLNLGVGDSFEQAIPLTASTVSWKIEAISPNWLHAFHYFLESFGQQFPEETGFVKFSVSEDNVEPIFEQVRRLGEQSKKQAELYWVHQFPLALAAGGRLGGAVSFAEYVRSLGKNIQVCSGTVGELQAAVALIHEHRQGGAVLDAVTALHAAEMGILPILQAELGNLSIPSTEVNLLKQILTDGRSGLNGPDGERMSLHYRDGQVIRHIQTAAEVEEGTARLIRQIQAIEGTCRVEPLVVSNTLSEVGGALVQLGAKNEFGPALLAGDGKLLLSEDMMMRNWAQSAFTTRGVWIQAVLWSAWERGGMSLDALADAAVYLSSRRHDHVMLNNRMLWSVYARDTTDGLNNLKTLSTFLRTRNADLEKHMQVIAGFLNFAWADAQQDRVKRRKAASMMFSALLSCYREDDWPVWAASFYLLLGEGARVMLVRWCKGHFLDFNKVAEVLRQ